MFEQAFKNIDGVWLASLREEASRVLNGKMTAFKGESLLSCPWLTRNALKPPSSENIEGIFMMQDWGAAAETEPLENAISFIEKALVSREKVQDRTIDNLLAVNGWRNAISEGRWIVMNAVWGLRLKHKKCGYLGNKIHKAAFRIWSKLVVEVAARRGSDFKLIVAGEWAVFSREFKDSQDGTIPLKDYLKMWACWCQSKNDGDRFDLVQGTVMHCPHPATWTYINVQNGPPA